MEQDLIKFISDTSKNNNTNINNKHNLIKKQFSFNENKNKNYIINQKKSKAQTPQKILGQLKLAELEIKRNISKLAQKEKNIKEKSYLDLNSNEKSRNINPALNKEILELKQISENKEIYSSQLNEIKFRINSLKDESNKRNGIYDNNNYKENMENYIQSQLNINTEKNKMNNPQKNEINKEGMKIRKNKNIDLNIFLTKKEPENIYQKNKEIQTIDLSPKNKLINNSYSSKGIPHAKYNQDKNPNLSSNNKNSIPIPKTSEIYRVNNTPNDNSLDIELNTTPSSHLDRSFDAINNIKQNNKAKTGKNNLNIYKPKRVNNKKSKIKEKKVSEINTIIPNQNIRIILYKSKIPFIS